MARIILILTLASVITAGCATTPKMETEVRVSYSHNEPTGEIVFRMSR